MKKLFLNIIIILSITYSCSNDDKLADPEPVSLEDKLLSLVYSSYKWPEGFYNEQLSNSSIVYENTVSARPANQRDGSMIELSTDDKNIAKQWSESAAKYSSGYREIVSESETEKYYEFGRVHSSNPSYIYLSRIHKYSYVDRSMYDFEHPQEIIGKFNKNNYAKNDVKELIEYLWFIKHYNNESSKVYSSEIKENVNEFIHSIYEIWTIYGIDKGTKDGIRYIKYTYTIKKSSGEFRQQKEVLKEFLGRPN